MSGGEREERAAPFRTIGVTTAWSVSEVQVMLAFLDALRAEIETAYAAALARDYHEQASLDAALDAQHSLDLEEPPF